MSKYETATWYFMDKAGQRQGPVTWDRFRHAAKNRKITLDSYCWNGVTVATWVKIRSVQNGALARKLRLVGSRSGSRSDRRARTKELQRGLPSLPSSRPKPAPVQNPNTTTAVHGSMGNIFSVSRSPEKTSAAGDSGPALPAQGPRAVSHGARSRKPKLNLHMRQRSLPNVLQPNALTGIRQYGGSPKNPVVLRAKSGDEQGAADPLDNMPAIQLRGKAQRNNPFSDPPLSLDQGAGPPSPHRQGSAGSSSGHPVTLSLNPRQSSGPRPPTLLASPPQDGDRPRSTPTSPVGAGNGGPSISFPPPRLDVGGAHSPRGQARRPSSPVIGSSSGMPSSPHGLGIQISIRNHPGGGLKDQRRNSYKLAPTKLLFPITTRPPLGDPVYKAVLEQSALLSKIRDMVDKGKASVPDMDALIVAHKENYHYLKDRFKQDNDRVDKEIVELQKRIKELKLKRDNTPSLRSPIREANESIYMMEEKFEKRKAAFIKNWKKWGPDDLCYFVTNIVDKGLAKFSVSVKNSLKVNEVKGRKLPTISAQQWAAWGMPKKASEKVVKKVEEITGYAPPKAGLLKGSGAGDGAGSPEAEAEKNCVVCLTSKRDCALVPCGHASFCCDCAKKLKECPICRKTVQQTMKIFT